MGMTIEEAIPILHDIYNYYNDTDIDAYIGFDKEDNIAIETALDTMHKYQKIEKIMAKRPKDMISSNPTLRSISKVLKDGNNDN